MVLTASCCIGVDKLDAANKATLEHKTRLEDSKKRAEELRSKLPTIEVHLLTNLVHGILTFQHTAYAAYFSYSMFTYLTVKIIRLRRFVPHKHFW